MFPLARAVIFHRTADAVFRLAQATAMRALLIGIDRYDDSNIEPLRYAVTDAFLLANGDVISLGPSHVSTCVFVLGRRDSA